MKPIKKRRQPFTIAMVPAVKKAAKLAAGKGPIGRVIEDALTGPCPGCGHVRVVVGRKRA